MRFTTLLPRHRNKPGHRVEAVSNDHAGWETWYVRGRVLICEDGVELLRLLIWTEPVSWVEIVINQVGDVLALAANERERDAWAAARDTLAFKGYRLRDPFRTLFTPEGSNGDTGRRTGRLIDDQGTWQVSAKELAPDTANEEGTMLQLRIRVLETTWLELVLSEIGDIVAQTVGSTEKDAWKAAHAVIRRKGYATV